MFDKLYIESPRRDYQSRQEIHEHRAPTDESIKLLNEMQEKTLKNIVAQFKVDNNVLSGIVTYFSLDMIHYQYLGVFQFKLNGIEHSISEKIDKFDLKRDKERVLRDFYTKVSQTISEELFNAAMKDPDGIQELYRKKQNEKF